MLEISRLSGLLSMVISQSGIAGTADLTPSISRQS
jgi:hypothetical protein